MEALLCLLVFLSLSACEGDRLRYYEDLYVKPLADGSAVNHFTFTTQWDISPEVLGHSANSGMFLASIACMRECVPFCYIKQAHT